MILSETIEVAQVSAANNRPSMAIDVVNVADRKWFEDGSRGTEVKVNRH